MSKRALFRTVQQLRELAAQASARAEGLPPGLSCIYCRGPRPHPPPPPTPGAPPRTGRRNPVSAGRPRRRASAPGGAWGDLRPLLCAARPCLGHPCSAPWCRLERARACAPRPPRPLSSPHVCVSSCRRDVPPRAPACPHACPSLPCGAQAACRVLHLSPLPSQPTAPQRVPPRGARPRAPPVPLLPRRTSPILHAPRRPHPRRHDMPPHRVPPTPGPAARWARARAQRRRRGRRHAPRGAAPRVPVAGRGPAGRGAPCCHCVPFLSLPPRDRAHREAKRPHAFLPACQAYHPRATHGGGLLEPRRRSAAAPAPPTPRPGAPAARSPRGRRAAGAPFWPGSAVRAARRGPGPPGRHRVDCS
jgi:hypothetical protein